MQESERSWSVIIEWFQPFERTLKPLGELLCLANDSERSQIKIPPQMIQAWLHGIMALVHLQRDEESFSKHMERCSLLIRKGSREILRSLGHGSIIKKSSLGPFEVLSLIHMELSGDVTGDSSNITDIYSEYSMLMVSMQLESGNAKSS
jgi:hypothetical protein